MRQQLHAALLLIGLTLQQPPAEKLPTLPTLYIRIGEDENSLRLKSELTRDWDKPPKHLDEYQAIEHRIAAMPLARERRKIRARIEFVRADRWSTSACPAWRIGRYGRWEHFDNRAFAFTGRPTRTVRWLIDHYNYDRWPRWERDQYQGPQVDDDEDEKDAKKREPKPPWENGH